MKSKTLLSLLAVTGAFLTAEITSAQSLPPSVRTPEADKTLGTQVSGNGNNFNITGGLNRGQTLFHSFKDFSIPTGGAANFNNPAGTRDIISRVTGGLFSDINGTLNSNGANFLLINPNGVVFGPNARLNVGKAFAASTASGVDLVDGQGRQVTFGTNPNGDAPLLTINPNVFFNVSQLNMGAKVPGNAAIINYGTLQNQTNNSGQYIGLIGGTVILNGKYGGGKIVAPGGRVDLVGLNSAGTVTTNDRGLLFSSDSLLRGDVSLINGGAVTIRANGTIGNINTFFGGTNPSVSGINISANNINFINDLSTSNRIQSNLESGLDNNIVNTTNPAGDINIDATGKITLDFGGIFNTLLSGAEGKLGNIKISTKSLDLNNQSRISSNTLGKGNAGNIDIKSTDTINIFGVIDLQSPLLVSSKDNLSIISSDTYGKGDTGKITIDAAGDLNLVNRGELSSTIQQDAMGNSQGIEIKNARNLNVLNFSTIRSKNLGTGNAGNINIKTKGNSTIAGTIDPNLLQERQGSALSSISSSTTGRGDAGKITIDTAGKLSVLNKGGIFSNVDATGVGNSNGIKVDAGELEIANRSSIQTTTKQTKLVNNKGGNAGNIDIKTKGNLTISGTENPAILQQKEGVALSSISSSTKGQGDAGKITIDTVGKLSVLNKGGIFSEIEATGVGNSNGIKIDAGELEIANRSSVQTTTAQAKLVNDKGGNAGNIDVKTKGNLTISGTENPTFLQERAGVALSSINSSTEGQGNAGKITIGTAGKLSVLNKGGIFSEIDATGVGNSNGITIDAGELEIANRSSIQTTTNQAKLVKDKGNAGDINITTKGNLTISGKDSNLIKQADADDLSSINSSTSGQGDAGKIIIDSKGKLSVSNKSVIFSIIKANGVGNSNGITIDAGELDIANQSSIETTTDQAKLVKDKGNAGDINITTNGNLTIIGTKNNSSDANSSKISSSSRGAGDAGKVTINTQGNKLFLSNRSGIFSVIKEGIGNSKGIKIDTGDLNLTNASAISTSNLSSLGNAGDIVITSQGKINLVNTVGISSFSDGLGNAGNIVVTSQGKIDLVNTLGISSANTGLGKAGNISITSNKLSLNKSPIFTDSLLDSGGDLKLNIDDYLLLRNNSSITTTSASQGKNGNGGNITIDSPSIVALPGNNDISANAFQGSGGKVDITSQGLFGIKYRPKGQDSLFTSDITASSTFGQNGVVDIKTPGTDPGKDSTILPTVPTDASNQIAQTCNASRENKFIIAGRGGLPPNANDPLTSDVVWQDVRAANNQPTASSTTNNPNKLPPPAVGLAFDGKGKAFLIAAGNEGQPTKTNVVCPNVVRK